MSTSKPPRAQALHTAVGPRFRHRGQKIDFILVGLQQHFANAGGDAEIAVHLHRRMQAKEVGTGVARGKQLLKHLVRAFAVVQTRFPFRADPLHCP
jgi:hypothetical protein